MKYTVTWRPAAIQELADIWMRAPNRDVINAAAARIEHYLRNQAPGIGEIHYDPARILVVPPLVVLFELRELDRQACVLSVTERH